MTVSPKSKLILSLGLILAAVAVLYPVETTVCPAWTIQVVDEAGNPDYGSH